MLRYFKESLNPNLFKYVYIPLFTLTVMEFYRALCDGLGVSLLIRKLLFSSKFKNPSLIMLLIKTLLL